MNILTYEIVNAVIEEVSLSNDDHGVLSARLHLNYGDRRQGFEGYSLYLPKSFHHHTLLSPAGHFIFRCLQVAEVTEWSKLKGKTIRVRRKAGWNGSIQAIGHIVKDDWFDPQKDFEEARSSPENGQEKN